MVPILAKLSRVKSGARIGQKVVPGLAKLARVKSGARIGQVGRVILF